MIGQELLRLLRREQALGLRQIYLPVLSVEDSWLMPSGQKRRSLLRCAEEVRACCRCNLADTRHNTVFGEGSVESQLLLVGEAPGGDEDRQGRPFVGACGKLLTRMLAAIGLERSEAYICNVLKCRPPGNRTPSEEEMGECIPYLRRQIDIIQPTLICALGRVAFHSLVSEGPGLRKARGSIYRYKDIPVVATFHPGYLLRNVEEKKLAWEDMKLIARLLGRPVD